MNEKIIFEKIKKIPPLSSVVVEVLNLIDSNSDIEFSILEKKIIQDSTLTGKLLSLANSSFFGMPGEIINVKEACLVLGINTIRNIIITSSVMDRFNNNQGNNLDFDKLWKHGICTAAAAKVYANKLGLNEDTAFICGLLHDIGKLIIDFYMPELYESALEYRSNEQCLFIDAEINVLGTHHGNVGAIVCENWKLPEQICNTIRMHHDEINIESQTSIVDVIYLADITSHGLGFSTIIDSISPMRNDNIFNKPGINISLVKESLPLVDAITESYINNSE